ncbi:MAG: hypothetical protein WAS90_12075 [Brachymonas denitrificans]
MPVQRNLLVAMNALPKNIFTLDKPFAYKGYSWRCFRAQSGKKSPIHAVYPTKTVRKETAPWLPCGKQEAVMRLSSPRHDDEAF